MVRSLPEAVYHAAARARRRWFARHPEARRVLARPVISVGNLAFGGSGKTPLVAAIASLLRELGERPAVLSRGYGRRRTEDGAVLVSDGDRILADVDRAGDEPVMLARALAGVVVVVSPQRYLAGRLAELHCAATVHILDDGFQHLGLARDVDLLAVDGGSDGFGAPLREHPDAARLADALLVARGTDTKLLPPMPMFHWWREVREAVDINAAELTVPTGYGDLGPALAVAAIAGPQRFFDNLQQVGADIRGTVVFPDHHAFTSGDVDRIATDARQKGCKVVLTTEKDAIRLRRFRPLPVRTLSVPLAVAFDPAENFVRWLADHLAFARARGHAA